MQTFYRNYDAALGRFVGSDPMPESAESITGYNYAGNNPVPYNDPMGDQKKDLIAMEDLVYDIGGKGGGGPNYKPRGPGSGNYWSDGIFLSDWSSMGGSSMFQSFTAAGYSYLGGLFYAADRSSKVDPSKVTPTDGTTYHYWLITIAGERVVYQ